MIMEVKNRKTVSLLNDTKAVVTSYMYWKKNTIGFTEISIKEIPFNGNVHIHFISLLS